MQQGNLQWKGGLFADFPHSRILHRRAVPRDRLSGGLEPESLEKHEKDDLCDRKNKLAWIQSTTLR